MLKTAPELYGLKRTASSVACRRLVSVPVPAPSAAASPGRGELPPPLPAAPAGCFSRLPVGGFGRSGSAFAAFPPAATPAHGSTAVTGQWGTKREALLPVSRFFLKRLTNLRVLQFAAQVVHLFSQFDPFLLGFLQQSRNIVQLRLTDTNIQFPFK